MTGKEVFQAMSLAVGEQGDPSPLAGGRDPFAVLVGTVISLRTRDAVTGPVTERVLRRAPDPETLMGIRTGELEDLLKPAGFYRRKAMQLKGAAEAVVKEHGGAVPCSREALEALPGVGSKTSAFVLSMAFGVPAICVDVHVHRISNRLGIVDTDTPEDTEKGLMQFFPGELWIQLNHVFVRFGQRVCLPRKPRCTGCPFSEWCRSAS